MTDVQKEYTRIRTRTHIYAHTHTHIHTRDARAHPGAIGRSGSLAISNAPATSDGGDDDEDDDDG